MTEEEKQLLLKDLCARLPYWPKVKTEDDDDAYIVGLDDTEKGLFYVHILEDGDSYDTIMSVEDIKPYLRPMSSMTEDEKKVYHKLLQMSVTVVMPNMVRKETTYIVDLEDDGDGLNHLYDWFNENHFDYRGLIEKSLAIVAPEEMYK